MFVFYIGVEVRPKPLRARDSFANPTPVQHAVATTLERGRSYQLVPGWTLILSIRILAGNPCGATLAYRQPCCRRQAAPSAFLKMHLYLLQKSNGVGDGSSVGLALEIVFPPIVTMYCLNWWREKRESWLSKSRGSCDCTEVLFSALSPMLH